MLKRAPARDIHLHTAQVQSLIRVEPGEQSVEPSLEPGAMILAKGSTARPEADPDAFSWYVLVQAYG